MRALTHSFFIIGILVVSCAGVRTSSSINNNELDQKRSAIIGIDRLPLDLFDTSNVAVLKRYLLGNAKWNYRDYRGTEYAERKEVYDTIENSVYDSLGILKRETKISFGNCIGIQDKENISFANTKKATIANINYSDYYKNTKVHSSCLIITSDEINIEIQEISTQKSRLYTQSMINELIEEFSKVIMNASEIEDRGTMNEKQFYPITHDSSFFSINNGDQHGIYQLEAALKINEPGIVYARAYEKSSGTRLSKGLVMKYSTRKMGWSKHNNAFFHYESEVRIREGVNSGPYEAVFELWFRNAKGEERMLTRQSKMITGWNRKANHHQLG